MASILLHPITIALVVGVVILIVLDRKYKGADRAIYSKIVKINKDQGLAFPVTTSQCENRAMRDYNHGGGNVMIDEKNGKIAIIRSKDDIAVHDLVHIRAWKPVPSGRHQYGNAIELTLNDMANPRFIVSIPEKKAMEDWIARLVLLLK